MISGIYSFVAINCAPRRARSAAARRSAGTALRHGKWAPLQPLQLAALQRTTTVDLQHATDNMGRATDSMRQITDNVHRAIDNNNAATDSGPHATDNLQRTRRNMQQTTEQKTLQPPTCNNATDHGSQKTENMQNCDRQQTACNMHETTDNKRNMHHTTCNMHHSKLQQTTDHRSKHDTIRDRQQATYDKQRQATRNHATDIPRHRGHLNRVAGAAAGESRHTRASRAATAHLFKHSVLRHAATAMPTAALRSYAHSTCAHAERVACAARTRCTHLHPRRTASMDAAVSGRTCWHPHR